ncbi:MAG: hypothetical protein ACRDDF_11645, partial [Aeromonas sp.]
TKTIVATIERFFKDEEWPDKIISDNAKEFCSQEYMDWCTRNSIERYTVAPESHRSNGRIERVIRTIRDALLKNDEVDLHKRLYQVIGSYNRSYHTGIKCSPQDALKDISGIANQENSSGGRYVKQFKSYKREIFEKGQQVRVSKSENLGTESKNLKGRFLRRGVIVNCMNGDSYLVKMDDGKITKKRHCDLKGLDVEVKTPS